jgi:drug/metabolite transporter (DMT)-like permease
VFGSIVAFACYLTLLNRIGAARSGYIGVMTPIVALVVSAFFESFQWHASHAHRNRHFGRGERAGAAALAAGSL